MYPSASGFWRQLVQVGAELATAEDADRSVVRGGVVAGVLERLPRGLEEQSVLRIGERGVARREAEEAGVEHVDVAEQRGGVDVAGQARDLIGYPGRPHVLAAQWRDRLHALRQVLPEVVEIVRAREPTSHADDGDRIVAARS